MEVLMELQDIQLVQSVGKRPGLWNVANNGYKRNTRNMVLWTDVAEEIDIPGKV